MFSFCQVIISQTKLLHHFFKVIAYIFFIVRCEFLVWINQNDFMKTFCKLNFFLNFSSDSKLEKRF